VRPISVAWFDHLVEICSYKKSSVQKKICLPAKTSFPPAENINETPDMATFHL